MWYDIHTACFYWFLSLFVGFVVLMRVWVQLRPVKTPLLEGLLIVTYSLFLATTLLYTVRSKETPRPEELAKYNYSQALYAYESLLKVDYGLHFTYLPCIYLSKLLLLIIFAKYSIGNRMAKVWIYSTGVAVVGAMGFELLLPLIHCKAIADNWRYRNHNSCVFNDKTTYVSVSLHLATNFLLFGIGWALLRRILPWLQGSERKRSAKFMFASGTIYVIFSIVYAGREIQLARSGYRSIPIKVYNIIMDLVMSIHQAIPIVIVCMPETRTFFMRQWAPRPNKKRVTEVKQVASTPAVSAQTGDLEANAAGEDRLETSSTLAVNEGVQGEQSTANTTTSESNDVRG